VRVRTLLVSLISLAWFAFPLAAQTTGQLEGLVRDPAGRPVPGAALRIVEIRTAVERKLSTDARGWYVATGLAPGAYEIGASHAGFRPEVRRGVELAAGRAARVDFSLQLGELRETVEVTAEAPAVSAAPSDWGGSIASTKLESLPLNGRDLFDLVSQQPGTTVSTTSQKTMTTGPGIRISVNGARPSQNAFRLDGIYINDATSSAPASASGRLLGLESIEELHLVSSAFDAEYGRAGGAVLTAVSKSGSNQWHGSAYEFLRNSALDAKNFFDPAGEKIPPLHKSQFGGLISGPLRQNRVFFLANYEGIRATTSQTMSAVTPTKAARQGQLPGGTVVVNPAVLPYLALYPEPTGRDFGDGTGEFISEGVTSSREDYVTGKVDAVPSSRLRAAVRYTFDDALTNRPEPLKVITFIEDSRYHFLHTEMQFVQSPSTIHSMRAGFSRVWNGLDSRQPASIPDSMSFVAGQPMGSIDFTAGLTAFGGVGRTTLAIVPRRFVVNDFQFSYSATHIHGIHAIRVGGSFDRVQFNERSDNNAMGRYTFSSLADFLQGAPRTGDLMLPGSDSIRGWRQSIYSGFLQDEIRVSSRLSATLGVRYEPYSAPTEANGKIATVRDLLHDTSTHVGGPVFKNPSKTNFAPRVSLAYDPCGAGKTVIRAGAGIFFDLLGMRELVVGGVRTPPFFSEASLDRPPFPNLLQAAQSTAPLNSLDILDYYQSQPYVAQFQFLVQQQVVRDTILQVGYVGARGVHLPGTIGDVNPNRPQVLPDGQLFFPATLNRLNPAFARIRTRRTQFDSSYHGLQAGLQHKLRRNLVFQLKYTWSKTLDNMSTVILGDFVNSGNLPTMFNYSLNRGRADFDVPHTFGVNFSYSIPQWGSGTAGQLLGGWELLGVLQVQAGPPFNPTVGFDRARLGGGGRTDLSQRPMYAGAEGANVILGDPQRWFDPSVFALPPVGMYGNLGRNTLAGPGLVTLDLALHKVIWRTERQSVRLRVEAFNVANHPNFQIPSATGLFDSTLARVGSAGLITETTTTSRQIQLALKWMF
jgi:hypothetical protein